MSAKKMVENNNQKLTIDNGFLRLKEEMQIIERKVDNLESDFKLLDAKVQDFFNKANRHIKDFFSDQKKQIKEMIETGYKHLEAEGIMRGKILEGSIKHLKELLNKTEKSNNEILAKTEKYNDEFKTDIKVDIRKMRHWFIYLAVAVIGGFLVEMFLVRTAVFGG